jgi:hypothetical protein
VNEQPCGRLEPAELQELRARLVHSAEAVALEIWGEPQIRTRREWRWGSNNGSLALEIRGRKRDLWCERSEGTGGDLLKALQQAHGSDFRAALERACAITGYRPASWDRDLTPEQRRLSIASQPCRCLYTEAINNIDLLQQCAMPVPAGARARLYMRHTISSKMEHDEQDRAQIDVTAGRDAGAWCGRRSAVPATAGAGHQRRVSCTPAEQYLAFLSRRCGYDHRGIGGGSQKRRLRKVISPSRCNTTGWNRNLYRRERERASDITIPAPICHWFRARRHFRRTDMTEILPNGKSGIFKFENTANDPAKLDRAADRALSQHGNPRLAEFLARRAAELREGR